MKKFTSIILSLMLALSMSTAVFAAENQDARFDKTYELKNDSTSSPAETFQFKFTKENITDSNKNLTVKDMPEIPNAKIDFVEGEATKEGLTKKVDVALADVNWPGVGVYTYTVSEIAGNTAGVTYDNTTAYLKVTVAYDEGTKTYYTAFVTLNLVDKNQAGITENKTGGFTNVYSAGKLSITKKVTGNLGDVDAYFAVKVKLTGEQDKTYAKSYAVTGGSYQTNPSTISIDTETTFYLKNNDTITIENLPYNVTYTVVEEDYTTDANGKYDAASYEFEDPNKKIDSASDKVTITNNKGVTVDTGIFVDSLPYILMLVIVAVGLVVFFGRKRMMRED